MNRVDFTLDQINVLVKYPDAEFYGKPDFLGSAPS